MLNIFVVIGLDSRFRLNPDIKEGHFSMSDIYDQEMIQIARDTFLKVGIPLVEGHYCYFALPNYESPAEIQVMHGMGAATVGASTLPE